MKYTNKLLTIAVVLSLLLAVGCKKDNPKPPEPVLGEKLSGTWKAVKDNAISGPTTEIETKFADFSITITATASQVSYSTNSQDTNVFPTSGTFDVEASDNFTSGAQIVRQPDGVDTNATVSSDGKTLTLKFNIDTSNARVSGIDGEYTFILDKQ